MPLKFTVETLSEVAEPLRQFYEPADSGFRLAVDGEPPGFVPAERLKEFRTNNRNLNARIGELEGKLRAYDGIDPAHDDSAEFERLEAKLRTFDGVDLAEYQALKARPDLAPRVAELEAQLQAAQESSDRALRLNAIGTVFLSQGGRPSAADYVQTLADKVFSVKDGGLSTEQFSAKDPGQPLSVAEWMEATQRQMPFLFLPSRGTGALPGAGDARPSRQTVAGADPVAFGMNLEAIARGDAIVE